MWSYSVDEFAASLGILYHILVWGVGLLDNLPCQRS